MATDVVQLLDSLLGEFEEALDVDVLVFNGPIRPETSRSFRYRIRQNPMRNRNVLLILSTLGGSPDDGYRIARTLQNRYDKFSIYIPSLCKSTGTLMAIGASEIILGEFGELGPLDIQIRKADEVGEVSSGLNVSAALAQIENRVCESFTRFFIEMKANFQLSTKTASEIATKLSQGIYGEIAEQVDPIQLGETNRSIRIAEHYGDSLNSKSKNLKDGALEKLIAAYPSHGYVIDIQEAKTLFNNVRDANEKELALFEALDAFFNLSFVIERAQDCIIWRVRDLINLIQNKSEGELQGEDQSGEDDGVHKEASGDKQVGAKAEQKNGNLNSQIESDVQPQKQNESQSNAAFAKKNNVEGSRERQNT